MVQTWLAIISILATYGNNLSTNGTLETLYA